MFDDSVINCISLVYYPTFADVVDTTQGGATSHNDGDVHAYENLQKRRVTTRVQSQVMKDMSFEPASPIKVPTPQIL